jgi:glucokinase
LLATREYADSVLAKDPSAVTSREVFLAARAGDLLATRISNEFADLLGLGIANIVSLVNPEIVILGGSVGSHAGFLIPRVLGVVKTCAQPVSGQAVQIVESTLAGDAGLLGAAYSILLKLNN